MELAAEPESDVEEAGEGGCVSLVLGMVMGVAERVLSRTATVTWLILASFFGEDMESEDCGEHT